MELDRGWGSMLLDDSSIGLKDSLNVVAGFTLTLSVGGYILLPSHVVDNKWLGKIPIFSLYY